MGTVLLIVLLLLVFGGLGYGGFGGGTNRYWGPTAQPGWNIGGIIGVILVIQPFCALYSPEIGVKHG